MVNPLTKLLLNQIANQFGFDRHFVLLYGNSVDSVCRLDEKVCCKIGQSVHEFIRELAVVVLKEILNDLFDNHFLAHVWAALFNPPFLKL